MITILLAEDHHLVRQGFKLVLLAEQDFKLVGEAADGLEAVQLAEKKKPSVLLLDLMIPRLHGLEVTRQVHKESPATKIVILSMHADEPYVMEALRNGASGYVLKDCTAADLVQAVRTVVAGRRYLSPMLAERALTGYVEHPGESELDVYDTLTGSDWCSSSRPKGRPAPRSPPPSSSARARLKPTART
jgi:DNA-binding NarL/FixJ family response regulator